MIVTDAPQYREATLEQLMAYADMFGVIYDSKMTGDVERDKVTIWDDIRIYMLDYGRLKAIEDAIFIGGRMATVGQLQILLSYDQIADGVTPKISAPQIWGTVEDDAFNYQVQKAVGNYILSGVSTFNTALSSTSGMWWSVGDHENILPCTAQYFKYHVWGTEYDNQASGAFFYPQATSANPEGWDGIGLGVNTAPLSGDAINYLRRNAPSGASYPYWKLSDIISTSWPNTTESNQSGRSALNSLIVSYVPCSGI